MYRKIDELAERRRKVEMGGGEEKIRAQHERGKLTARERVDLLLDEGTFVELNPFVEHRATHFGMDKVEAPGEGVLTGFGKIHGRPVYVFAQDRKSTRLNSSHVQMSYAVFCLKKKS